MVYGKENDVGKFVACMGENRKAYVFYIGKLEGLSHLEDTGMDGRIIFNVYYINGMGGGGLDL
jgi:hypothetical protein